MDPNYAEAHTPSLPHMTRHDELLEFYRAIEARANAHFALHTKLPGRILYFKASMRRAIAKWQSYKQMVRAGR